MKSKAQSDSGRSLSLNGDLRRRGAEHSSHSAHFYSSDSLLINEIGRRMAVALLEGGAAIALATPPHQRELQRELELRGLDLAGLARQGRWISRNAAETLAAFMTDGWPDEDRFERTLGALVDAATGAVACGKGFPHPHIAAYGEMVTVLWEQGNTGAAVRVEELWTQLAETRRFHLSCGWPLRFFSHDRNGVVLRRICSEHSHVVPDKGCENMSEEEPRRHGVLWQLQAQALDEDSREGRKVRQILRARKGELRDFLATAVIGMPWLAPDGTILWANRTELEMPGYSAEEYVGRGMADVVLPDASAMTEMLRMARSGETIRGYELPVRRGDGVIGWIRLDASPWIRNGEIVHGPCFTVDGTTSQRADEAQMLLAAIVESSDDAIVSKNLDGIVTSWNAAAERILGYKAAEMIGKPVLTIIPPELHGDEREILRRIRAGERIEHFETVRVTKSGERLDVSLTISPVRNAQGGIIGAAKVLRDVTAGKKMEAALRTTERLASVGRLAATVAHEINNPLEAVTNLIYLARMDAALPEGVRACLTAADGELQRVSHIARQTLGFYRDTSHPITIDVAEAIGEVLAIYERRLRYKEVAVHQDVQPRLTVCALLGEFKQVLSNLVVNAIDASPKGTKIRIRAWFARHPVTAVPGIRLTVADEGAGIPVANLQRVFMPFFTTKRDIGTGLGLWITRDLLEKKGGGIRCRSHVAGEGLRGSGTVMMLFLPTANPEECVRAAAA
jgi:PAS domain S-box-containing protein